MLGGVMFFYESLKNVIKMNSDGTVSIVNDCEEVDGVTSKDQLPKTEIIKPMSGHLTPKNQWREAVSTHKIIATDMPDFYDMFGYERPNENSTQ